MPIKGLTDRGAAFPHVGVLRKGGKKVSDNKPGSDLQYFRFQTDDKEAEAAFAKAYPGEPKVINILLPFRTAAENFEAWQEEWVAGGLKHRCDGENIVLWLTPRGKYSTESKPCPGGCKATGRLHVVIPELKRLALVTVLTTSLNDIMEIQQNVEALEATRGNLQGIPLLLKRVPRKISTPAGEGKRARREKWLIHIEAQPQWVELQLKAAQEAALPGAHVVQLALPPGPSDDDDDDEFDPRIEHMKRVVHLEDELIKAMVLLGKSEDQARATFNKSFAKCNSEELERHLDKAWAAIRVAYLESIEKLSNQLGDMGIKSADIADVVNAITGGEMLEGCGHELLSKVDGALKELVEKGKQAAA